VILLDLALATAMVMQAPPCAGHWEQVATADGPWTFNAEIRRGAVSPWELRDEHGRLMAVQRAPSTTYWRCVPAPGGLIS
jgi:hypothetical protein